MRCGKNGYVSDDEKFAVANSVREMKRPVCCGDVMRTDFSNCIQAAAGIVGPAAILRSHHFEEKHAQSGLPDSQQTVLRLEYCFNSTAATSDTVVLARFGLQTLRRSRGSKRGFAYTIYSSGAFWRLKTFAWELDLRLLAYHAANASRVNRAKGDLRYYIRHSCRSRVAPCRTSRCCLGFRKVVGSL